MNREEFISKWIYAYESKEEEQDFKDEMRDDLDSLINSSTSNEVLTLSNNEGKEKKCHLRFCDSEVNAFGTFTRNCSECQHYH